MGGASIYLHNSIPTICQHPYLYLHIHNQQITYLATYHMHVPQNPVSQLSTKMGVHWDMNQV